MSTSRIAELQFAPVSNLLGPSVTAERGLALFLKFCKHFYEEGPESLTVDHPFYSREVGLCPSHSRTCDPLKTATHSFQSYTAAFW